MSYQSKIPNGWNIGTLQDLVFFQRGFDITKAQQKQGQIPVISSSGTNSFHSESKVDGPGVIIGRKGTLGSVHFATGPYWPHDTTLWSKDFQGNNPRYVYYFLQTLGLERYNVGNANPTLNRNHIHKIEILIPSTILQDRIASILSAYDDLIENNLRRIVLLEQSARELYKEWFVRFKFPGHEKVQIVDGVPEGWEKKKLSEIAESIRYGFTASASFENTGIKILRITDIVKDQIEWGSVPFCEIEEKDIEKFKLRTGDIVVARTGATVGYAKRIHKRTPNSVFASYLVRFRFKSVDDIFLGTLFESDYYKNYIRNNMSGAAQPNANAKIMGNYELAIPSSRLQKEFRKIVEQQLDQIDYLLEQNQLLKQARDLLLPRLMKGEIEV